MVATLPDVMAPSLRGNRWRQRPVLTGVSVVVVAMLLLPLAFLVLQATQVGWGQVSTILFRHLTAVLLWNTVELTAVVTLASAVIGTAAAWATERTMLPGRRVWAALVVLPVAIPDYVIAWGWKSSAPSLHGLGGAALVLTLGLYPLVYLPVAASLRRADPAQEEVARSLGLGPWRTFWSVTLRHVRLALFGGCLLVALYLLAEYGAFSIMGYNTFTTEIFAEFNVGGVAATAALSLVLVALGVAVLGGEAIAARAGRQGHPQARARGVSRSRLGRSTMPVLAAMAALVTLAVGIPVWAIIYWLGSGQRTSLPSAGSTLASAAWHTALFGAAAAVLATLLALPVAILAVRHRGRLSVAFERTGLLVQALPGLVVALAIVYFAEHHARFSYQTAPLLVVAYAVMFFPLALVSVRASVARVPPALEEVARSLGSRPGSVMLRVTVPLVLPGLLAAFFLVFLTAVTELPATLLLVPTGVQTLATGFWSYSSDLAYGAAAPFALAMLGVAVVPTVLLGRWFDRLPSRNATVK